MTKNNIYNQIMNLDISSTSQIEYVWIGGHEEMRSKSKTLNIKLGKEVQLDDIPIWNYDGSSTEQATGEDSEVILKAANVFIDPFRKAPNVLVLCETYRPNGEPLPKLDCAVKDAELFRDTITKAGFQVLTYKTNN